MNYAGIILGIIGKGIMPAPEQCRHNRGSFLSWFFFLSFVVLMYTCTCIYREFVEGV